jgi:hypothetical protein
MSRRFTVRRPPPCGDTDPASQDQDQIQDQDLDSEERVRLILVGHPSSLPSAGTPP